MVLTGAPFIDVKVIGVAVLRGVCGLEGVKDLAIGLRLFRVCIHAMYSLIAL